MFNETGSKKNDLSGRESWVNIYFCCPYLFHHVWQVLQKARIAEHLVLTSSFYRHYSFKSTVRFNSRRGMKLAYKFWHISIPAFSEFYKTTDYIELYPNLSSCMDQASSYIHRKLEKKKISCQLIFDQFYSVLSIKIYFVSALRSWFKNSSCQHGMQSYYFPTIFMDKNNIMQVPRRS